MTTELDDFTRVLDLISGRWRSQILHAGVALGVFDAVPMDAGLGAPHVAALVGADPALLYRLLRALATIGLLLEDGNHSFSLTEAGRYLRADHPQSLRAMVLLEEGPVHHSAWRHLPELVRTGGANGFEREFGVPVFEYFDRDPLYATTFAKAMTSYSAGEAMAIRQAYQHLPFGEHVVLCDLGGGHGGLLAELLQDNKTARGIVLDLPEVSNDHDRHVPLQRGLGDRCQHIGGDMFVSVPTADVYFMKHILHDWSDEDCVRALSVARKAGGDPSRMNICEMIVPGPEQPHFSKLIDIHMLCVSNGKQRTLQETQFLLEASGWKVVRLRPLERSAMSVVEAVAA